MFLFIFLEYIDLKIDFEDPITKEVRIVTYIKVSKLFVMESKHTISIQIKTENSKTISSFSLDASKPITQVAGKASTCSKINKYPISRVESPKVSLENKLVNNKIVSMESFSKKVIASNTRIILNELLLRAPRKFVLLKLLTFSMDFGMLNIANKPIIKYKMDATVKEWT